MMVRTVKLRELTTLITKGTTPTTIGHRFRDDGLPFIRAEDITGGVVDIQSVTKRIDPSCHEAMRRSQLRPHDLLITIAGTVGRTAFIPDGTGAANCNQAVCIVRLKPHAVDLSFLLFAIRSDAIQRQLKAQGTTATITNVSLAQIGDLNIPLPPVSTQRRLVDILSRAEGIVRLRREAQEKATALIPSIFADMFGDPQTNPKGWPIVPLDTVSEVISGVAKGRQLNSSDTIELPYMRVANVKDGHLDLGEVKTMLIRRTEVPTLRIEPGDLLMTEGGDPDKLGRAALWHGEIDLCVHQNHIFKVRSKRSRLSPVFLRSLAGSHYGKAYFLSVAKKTTGIASINKTQLRAFPVVLPPIEQQIVFETRIAAIESIQAQQTTALNLAEATFLALLDAAFRNVEKPSRRFALDTEAIA